VVSAEVEIGGRDSSDSPFRLGRKSLRLIIARRRCDDLVAVLVDRPCGRSSQL